ncbi:MAG: hypothetical protein ACXVA9_05795, partial [Bdellovibrionales bacterium]
MSSRPQKLGILISSVESPWKSCNSISPNLVQSYTLLERDPAFQVEWLRVCPRSEAKDLRIGTGFYLELAGKIYAGGTTDLIFLDHHIDPLPLLLALKTLSIRQFRKLRFSIHIYGDFTLVPERWIEIGKILEGTQTKLICASERQKRMVSFFEPTGPSATSVCPFPVNTKMFAFSTKFRAQIRKRLGVGDKQTLLLYTGRISLQKCVLRLIEEFHQLCTEGRGDLYLAIAGPIVVLGGMTSDII